ncbi:Ycf48-like protein [Paenibacillus konkukensis]|uniref:Ycf48-like protein n=1 Tax=Paenibacillus konkukensis TaxID=2020716 RepID=A0ABY4RMH8_9BACL|nr:hypothetical protein [Paenibacillus konkukensis]UQZ83155.1 Ycf48-like protein [Paenibacillus konkukensis]
MTFMKSSRLLILTAVFILALAAGCQHQPAAANTPANDSPAVSADQEPAAQQEESSAPPAASGGNGASDASGGAPADPSKPVQSSEHAANEVAVGSVQFVSATEGWTGGPGAVLHTKDGGKTWETQYQGAGSAQSFSFLNNQVGWAYVSPNREAGQAGKDGAQARLLHTGDGGAHWSAVAEAAPIGPDIRFISEQEGFSGNQYTADGGKTWTALPIPANTKGEPFFLTKDQGWAVTMKDSNYEIQLTKDGGKTWKPVWTHATVSQVTGATIRSTESSDVWVLLVGETGMNQTSYTLLHSKDEGKSWKPVVANSTAGGGPAPGYKINEQAGPKGPGTKPGQLIVVNPQTAFLTGVCPPCSDMGAVTVGWTQDGGITWTNGEQQLPGVEAEASFIDGKQGWIVIRGYDKPSVLYRTQDGGKKWDAVHTFGKPAS